MVKKTLYNFIVGAAWGCLILSIIGVVYALMSRDSQLVIDKSYFIKQIICSIIVGIGFWVPSIVYEFKNLSNMIKILIHMGVGIVVYVIAGFYAGWIPKERGVVFTISTILGMAIISFIIWSGFYIHDKKEAKLINKKLHEKSKA